MLERWGDRYCLIGPYNPHTAAVEFEEQPTYGSIRETLAAAARRRHPLPLRPLAHPRPAARDPASTTAAAIGQLDHDKYLLWKDHGIATHAGDGEVNEVVAFGFAVAEFFRVFTRVVKDRPILAHFHEWMGGVAVPRIAHLRLPMATVFTTHATLLGRYLAGDNPYFYDHLPFLDADARGGASTRSTRASRSRRPPPTPSTVFTTVSEVTGRRGRSNCSAARPT